MRLFLGIFLIILTINFDTHSQFINDSTFQFTLITPFYSYQFPQCDLARRFSSNSNIGGAVFYKNQKNWLFGAEGSFIFASKVKEDDILDNLKTSDGEIINKNGMFADIRLYERGYTVMGKFGKIFSLSSSGNSGIIAIEGIGLLQHKIRIEDIGNTCPQLAADYKKGYDRLSNGLAISEFIGYIYFSNNRLINLYGGVEFIEAWTKNRRTYNYDTMEKDNEQRFDLLIGIKAGWIIPFYRRVEGKKYFY